MHRLLAKLPGGPKTIPLGDEALTIGRTNDNKLPLDADGVSRKHAQILFVGKGYEVVDLGSRNGTKVNGQKVPRAILKGGDVIHIGGVDLVFEDDAPAGVYNAGTGIETRVVDVVGALAARLGRADLVDLGALAYRRGEVMRYALDPSRARARLGFAFAVALARGLEGLCACPEEQVDA